MKKWLLVDKFVKFDEKDDFRIPHTVRVIAAKNKREALDKANKEAGEPIWTYATEISNKDYAAQLVKEPDVHRLIIKDTLGVLKYGSDETNFKILNCLPSSIKILASNLDLTEKSVHVRINRLEHYGLVERIRGKGDVNPTILGQTYLKFVQLIMDAVQEALPEEFAKA